MKKVFNAFVILMISASSIFAQGGASIKMFKEVHDFGVIKEENGLVATKFEFQNTGTAPLIINDVQASCGCTAPTWTKQPILPGQKGTIDVTYDPKNRPGVFEKTITISSNATNNPKVVVNISGEVIPLPFVRPEGI